MKKILLIIFIVVISLLTGCASSFYQGDKFGLLDVEVRKVERHGNYSVVDYVIHITPNVTHISVHFYGKDLENKWIEVDQEYYKINQIRSRIAEHSVGIPRKFSADQRVKIMIEVQGYIRDKYDEYSRSHFSKYFCVDLNKDPITFVLDCT